MYRLYYTVFDILYVIDVLKWQIKFFIFHYYIFITSVKNSMFISL